MSTGIPQEEKVRVGVVPDSCLRGGEDDARALAQEEPAAASQAPRGGDGGDGGASPSGHAPATLSQECWRRRLREERLRRREPRAVGGAGIANAPTSLP